MSEAHPSPEVFLDALSAMAVCVRLSRAGCRLLDAHVHGGLPVVVVDRRPPLPDLMAGCLRADSTGRHYRCSLGEVRVAWHEPRQAINPPGRPRLTLATDRGVRR